MSQTDTSRSVSGKITHNVTHQPSKVEIKLTRPSRVTEDLKMSCHQHLKGSNMVGDNCMAPKDNMLRQQTAATAACVVEVAMEDDPSLRKVTTHWECCTCHAMQMQVSLGLHAHVIEERTRCSRGGDWKRMICCITPAPGDARQLAPWQANPASNKSCMRSSRCNAPGVSRYI